MCDMMWLYDCRVASADVWKVDSCASECRVGEAVGTVALISEVMTGAWTRRDLEKCCMCSEAGTNRTCCWLNVRNQ